MPTVTTFNTTLAGLTPAAPAANAVTLSGILSLSSGGTGGTTQQAAANAILPLQAGNSGKYLTTNGFNTVWANFPSGPGAGTVTSVQASGGATGLSFGGGPITTAGTLTLGGTLLPAFGGTGANSLNGALNNMLPLQVGFAGQVLSTDGTNTLWVPLANNGTVKSVNVNGGTTGMTFFGGPIVNSGVITMTGILGITNGGTGASSPNQALNNLLPVQNATTLGKYLMSTGVDATWQTVSGGGGGGGGAVQSVNASGGLTGLTFTGGPINAINPTGTLLLGGILAPSAGGLGINATTATQGQVLMANGTGGLVAGDIVNTDTYISVDKTVAGTITLGLPKNSITLGTTVAYLGDTEPFIAGLNYARVTATDSSNSLNLATIAYVDSKISNVSIKAPVIAASTANLVSLSGLLTVDGVTLAAGNRVLVKNQSTSTQDGIYVAAAGPWTRATDADTDAELIGASVFVTSGGQASSTWVQTDPTPGTSQSWVQSAGAGTYTAGTGLTLTGQQFNISNTAVTPGSYGTGLLIPQIQVNQQGQITSASNVAVNTVLTFSGGATGFNPNTPQSGAVTLTGRLNLLSGGTGLDASNAADGSILIANGPSVPGAGDASFSLDVLTAGVGIQITRAPGTVTITNTGGGGGGGVTTFSGGATGLTPAVASSGVVTLGGKLAIASGGTNATTATQAFLNLAPGISGNTGKYLTTDGVSTVSWAALPAGLVSAYAITVTTPGTIVFKLGAAGITDAVGNIYEFFNSTGSSITLTTTTITNTAAFSSVSTASSIIIPASGSVTIVTTTAGSVYSVLASNLGTGAISPATLGDIPTLLANGSLIDSGKYFDDATQTNSNYWSANQTANYVITQLLNVPSLPQVAVATTANVGLTGLAAIDGYTPTAGDIVLVKNQTTSGQNGIYKAAAGAWTRQVYNTATKVYQNISTETLYSQLNINGGVTNVVNGTANKNVQFQFYIPDPTATIATNGSSVFVTSVTKLPVASPTNRFVDTGVGNDTNNNGSSAFPFATISRALTGAQFPATITVSSSGVAEASNITWSSSQVNCVVQGQNTAHDGGQTSISSVMTFANNNTRVDFVNTTHTNATPFVFANGSQCRGYFQGLSINNAGGDWLGLHSSASNFITLDDLNFGTANGLANWINLPSFTNAFTINVENQNAGVMRFVGAGAANTLIVLNNCIDGYVQIPSTYVGNIFWAGSGFSGWLGSAAIPTGILSSQAAMNTVTAWTTDTTYDGWYAIDGFAPTTFQQGAIFGKYTLGGTTFLYWGRTQLQAPATISTTTETTYQKTATGWALIGGTSALAQDLAGGAAGQVIWQQGANDSAFTAVGATGQHLISNGTASPTWATVPQSNYIATSTGGTVASRITAAGLTDVKGASYVIYNSGGTAIVLNATGFGNYQSFSTAATSTTLTINPFQSAVITTTTATTNYAIDSVTGLAGGTTVYAVSTAADATLASILTTASIVDAAQAVYVITNTDTASHTVALGTTILNPSAFPGYAANPNITIPAGGTATVTTASPGVSYYVMNISNSVAADLSAGLINEIPYQVGPSNTGFIANVAGDANKYLMSNGVSSAPAWTIAPGTHYLAAAANSTVPSLISTASLVDVDSASYTIVNTGVANINITAGNFVNSASFSTVATATQVTLKPNQTLVISTRTPNTNYVIDTVSGLGGGGTTALTISTGGTLAALLTAASVSDQVGNTYVVTNTASTSTPLTVGGTIDNATSFPNSIATNVVTLLPKQVVTLTTTAVGTNYAIENLSNVQTVFGLSTAADAAFGTILSGASILDYVGNVYTINNTDTAAHTITFGAVTGYAAFAGQTTNTTVIIPAGGSATVFTTTVNSTYQLVTIANSNAKTYAANFSTAGATFTIPQVLSGLNFPDIVGATYSIYMTLTAGQTWTATSFANVNSFARFGATSTSFKVPFGFTITFTTKVVGSTYHIENVVGGLPEYVGTLSADGNVTDILPTNSPDLLGNIYTIQNAGTANITVTASASGSFSNYKAYPTCYASNTIELQPNQTLTVCTESNAGAATAVYRIISVSTYSGSSYQVYATASGTITATLAAQTPTAVPKLTGNRYVIQNNGANTITLTAAVVGGYAAFANQATATSIALLPGANCEIACLSSNADSWSIITMSQTGSSSTNTFSVGATSAITVPGSTGVIAFNTINFDPMNWWNAAQSRWVPQVAGYYQVNLVVSVNAGSVDVVAGIQKNGLDIASDNSGIRGGWSSCAVSTVVYMNGTTDYLQGVGRAGVTSAGAPYTQLSASLQTAQPAVFASNAVARATVAATQAISNNAYTKMALARGDANPRGWFDTINYQFKPTVAGYYNVTASIAFTIAWNAGVSQIAISKNGFYTAYNATPANSANIGNMFCEVTDMVYMNGTTDYLEVFVYQTSGVTQTLVLNYATCYLDASLVGGVQVATGSVTQGTSNTFKINALGGGTGQAVGTSPTLLTLSNTIFDPTGAYTSGNGRFTPKTAGYYRLVGRAGVLSSTQVYGLIYLNGASIAANFSNLVNAANVDVEVSTVAYFNGTTDYAEFLLSSPPGATTLRTDNSGQFNEFSGELIGGVTSTPLATGPQLFKAFTGQALSAYVGLDTLQVAWKFNGSLFYVVLKTTTGSMQFKGLGRYYNGNGGYGNFQTGTGNSSPITVGTTDVNVFGWGFGSDGNSIQLIITDISTGYTYTIDTMLGIGGNNNYTTIQRNSNNA